jgi:SAM-dependent methyltransferase
MTSKPRFAQTLLHLNEVLRSLYANGAAPNGVVLEAGGGSFSHFALPPTALPVALDIDLGQLRRNQTGSLLVQADLQKLPIRPGSCAMVVCFNVVEHMPRPDLALDQMVDALRPGGLLLLGFPERSSLKGWITRLTPIGVHRWFYRRVVQKSDRGGAHFDAFETLFHPLVSQSAMASRLRQLGCELVENLAYDGAKEYGLTVGSLRRRMVGAPYYLACATLRALSLWRWRPELSDVLMLVRKRD